MKLFYFPTPDLVLPSSSPSSIPPPDAAVAVDVLRATTTIARLLHCGAEAVQCFSDLDELRAAAERFRPVERRLLVGERGGQKLDGFDLGNAPSSVRRERVGGKRVFFSTSNGTRALHRVRDCPRVYAASLTNRSAVASRLRRDLHEFSSRGNNSDGEQNGGNVWIVGSGWQGNFSLEDTFGAGAVASALMTNQLKGFVDDTEITAEPGNDELVAALAVWDQWKGDPLGCLRASSHGKRLEALLGEEAGADLECCAAVDSLDVVPYQTEPGVLKGSWL